MRVEPSSDLFKGMLISFSLLSSHTPIVCYTECPFALVIVNFLGRIPVKWIIVWLLLFLSTWTMKNILPLLWPIQVTEILLIFNCYPPIFLPPIFIFSRYLYTIRFQRTYIRFSQEFSPPPLWVSWGTLWDGHRLYDMGILDGYCCILQKWNATVSYSSVNENLWITHYLFW